MINTGETPAASTAPAVRMAPDSWEDVIDALGSAASLTANGIDCDTCRGTEPCDDHDDDWDQIRRWRSLAVRLRNHINRARDGQPMVLVERLEDVACQYFSADSRPGLALGWQQDFIAQLANYLAECGTDIGYTDGSRVRAPRR